MAYGAHKYPALRKKALSATPERDWSGVILRAIAYVGGTYFMAHAVIFALRLMGVIGW
jgi:hypothetical protein